MPIFAAILKEKKEMKRILTIAALLLLAGAGTFAQNISVRAGHSKMLYDGRYFPALYGENVSPITPSFNLKFGWQDYSDSPYAKIGRAHV